VSRTSTTSTVGPRSGTSAPPRRSPTWFGSSSPTGPATSPISASRSTAAPS